MTIADRITHYAIEEGFGYKSANQILLNELTAEVNQNLRHTQWSVPSFLPISNGDVEEFLFEHFPQLESLWNQFLATFDQNQVLRFIIEPKSEHLHISDSARLLLQDIQSSIINLFQAQGFGLDKLRAWLDTASPAHVIVRSTGKEDTENLANAGGNLSIPNVPTDPQAISDAIGEVVASYFGEKSIGQRLLAADTSLFLEPPFCPVLVQEMVTEESEVPRCGVLFSYQPEKSHQVTVINTGLGHNEGVVNSIVAVDSYFIDQRQEVQRVIREKPQRLKPLGSRQLALVDNDLLLARSQTLPDEILKEVKLVTDFISTRYGDGEAKPMDMEYSSKLGAFPHVYLLQARPLLSTAKSNSPHPSYIDPRKLNTKDTLKCGTLLDGNSWVRQICDAEQVIFADDMPSALIKYLDSPSKDKIQAIISAHSAPATSHEAITLRTTGVAVLVVSDRGDFSKIRSHIESASAGSPVLIDPQRELIALKSQAPICKGYFNYPIPRELSLPPSDITQSEPSDAHKEITERYRALLLTLAPNGLVPQGESVTELLQRAGSASPEEAKQACAGILLQLWSSWGELLKSLEPYRSYLAQEMCQALEAAMKLIQNSVIPAIEEFPAQSLDRLYPLRFLEACIFQQAPEDVIDAVSYATVLSKDRFERHLIRIAEKYEASLSGPKPLNTLYTFAPQQLIMSQKNQAAWNQFAASLSRDPAAVERLSLLIAQAQGLGVGFDWSNLRFPQVWQAHFGSETQATATLTDLEDEFKASEACIKRCTQYQHLISHWKRQENQFRYPEHVTKVLPNLRHDFLEALGFGGGADADFVQQLQQATPLGKLMLLATLEKAVDCYDRLIKAVKGSTNYSSDQQKLSDFAKVLDPYRLMMQSSLFLLSRDQWHDLMQPEMGYGVPRKEYLKGMDQGMQYWFGWERMHRSLGFLDLSKKVDLGVLSARDQFVSRPEFNVASFAIGSKADYDFSVHWPSRLEEYFTSFHQNIEQVRRLLLNECGLRSHLLPSKVQTLCRELTHKVKQNPSSISYDGTKVEVVYQIPLRQHSACLTLSSDLQHPELGMTLTLVAFGNDEHRRWDQLACWGALMALGPWGLELELPPQIDYSSAEGVRLTLGIPETFSSNRNLANTIEAGLLWLTMSTRSVASACNRIKSLMGHFHWLDVDPSFFSQTFHFTPQACGDLMDEGIYQAVPSIVEETALGLKRKGMNDYTRHWTPYSATFDSLNHDPKYAFIPPGHSLLKQLGLALVHCAHIGVPDAKETLVKLSKTLSDSQPRLAKAFRWATDLLSVGHDRIQRAKDYWADGKYIHSLVLAPRSEREDLPRILRGLRDIYDSGGEDLCDYFIETLKTHRVVDPRNQVLSQYKDFLRAADRSLLFWNTGDPRAALIEFYECPTDFQPLIAKIYQWLTETTSSGFSAFFQDLIRERSVLDAYDTYSVLAKILVDDPRLSEAGTIVEEAFSYLERRYQFSYTVVENGQELRYTEDPRSRIQLACQVLVGASQSRDLFSWRLDGDPPFQGLQDYLNKDRYAHVPDNNFDETWSCTKAATLYLILGLESNEEVLRTTAERALTFLIQDYLECAGEDYHNNEFLMALEAICHSYRIAEIRRGRSPEDAQKLIDSLWEKRDVYSTH